jgi:hypothetical protein
MERDGGLAWVGICLSVMGAAFMVAQLLLSLAHVQRSLRLLAIRARGPHLRLVARRALAELFFTVWHLLVLRPSPQWHKRGHTWSSTSATRKLSIAACLSRVTSAETSTSTVSERSAPRRKKQPIN